MKLLLITLQHLHEPDLQDLIDPGDFPRFPPESPVRLILHPSMLVPDGCSSDYVMPGGVEVDS